MISFYNFQNFIENVLFIMIMIMKNRINSAYCYRQKKFDFQELENAKMILINRIQKRSETEHIAKKQAS